jgi:hypothetical protein
MHGSRASGKSHYEQVRDAAVNALANARSVLEYANQASQRMREQDESLFQFSEQVADRAADFQNRLIELHGYPSDRRPRGQRPRPYHERCRGSEQRPRPGELPAGCASNPGSRLVSAPGTGRDPAGDVGVETCRTADRERAERAGQLARRDGRPDAVHRVPRRDAGRRDRHHQPGDAGDDRAGGTYQTDAVGVSIGGIAQEGGQERRQVRKRWQLYGYVRQRVVKRRSSNRRRSTPTSRCRWSRRGSRAGKRRS